MIREFTYKHIEIDSTDCSDSLVDTSDRRISLVIASHLISEAIIMLMIEAVVVFVVAVVVNIV